MFDFKDLFSFFGENENFDWEQAKKTGKVEEFEEIKNGIKTTIRKYTDDKGHTYSYTSSHYVDFSDIKSVEEEIKSIEKEIQQAIKLEDYELAASLAKRKKQLKEKNN